MKINSFRGFVKESLKGNILEIGGLAAPFSINAETKITYTDKYDGETLKKMCKEHLLGYHDNELKIEDIISPDVVCEADTLPFSDNIFDAVVCSHVLEHLVNPYKAIFEWLRVVAPQGYIYIVVPDKRYTFDAKRETTLVQHMVDDYEQDIKKIDKEHYIDFYSNVHNTNINDCMKRFEAGDNIHVHTFTFDSVIEMFNRYDGVYHIEDIVRFDCNICVLLKKE